MSAVVLVAITNVQKNGNRQSNPASASNMCRSTLAGFTLCQLIARPGTPAAESRQLIAMNNSTSMKMLRATAAASP